MAHDIMGQFYACLTWPLKEQIPMLTRMIEHTGPNRDMQTIFPQLIDNIFGQSHNSGWGLRIVNFEANEAKMITKFLEPQGALFQLIYKLLEDPLLKYSIPLSILPLDLQMSLEKGRCSQFYADMLTMDSQSLNVVALSLNPFDYYIFSFALHLTNTQGNGSWENWNSAYFDLACDYLMHFLPSDPNCPVLPPIHNYTGKVLVAAPLQTVNRPLSTSSLLIIPNLTGINNQHATTQNQSRNEIWRSETVLQVFLDIWMSIDQYPGLNIVNYQRNYTTFLSSPDRVRIVRALVKHLHCYSSKYTSGIATCSSSLRKYAKQAMCTRCYSYVKHLATIWPLDSSFRLVMELWLSLIQPWRYTDNSISRERYLDKTNNQEERSNRSLDPNVYIQFIAENFPAYTCIFQIVLPRFTRFDLTTYKNAVMLFRLGKVYSQQHLVPILKELEQGIMENNSNVSQNFDSSYNNSFDQSFAQNGVAHHKWAAVAKQAISELNMSTTNVEYEPIWGEGSKQFAVELVKYIAAAMMQVGKNLEEITKQLNQPKKGVWTAVKNWLKNFKYYSQEELLFEEYKKVSLFLNLSIHFFSNIFGLNENMLLSLESVLEDTSLEDSSIANLSNIPLSITNKLRNKSTCVKYMGDPDLTPITSRESTILVRMLYQISSRLNELYGDEFSRFWYRNDYWGYIAREILHEPCTIQTYTRRTPACYQNIERKELPPRLSLRRFGSYAFITWFIVGYIVFRIFSYSGITYVFVLIMSWLILIFTRATLKMLDLMKS